MSGSMIMAGLLPKKQSRKSIEKAKNDLMLKIDTLIKDSGNMNKGDGRGMRTAQQGIRTNTPDTAAGASS